MIMKTKKAKDGILKIGYIQFSPVFGDLEATIDILGKLMEETSGVDLIVLPELCNSGYKL